MSGCGVEEEFGAAVVGLVEAVGAVRRAHDHRGRTLTGHARSAAGRTRHRRRSRRRRPPPLPAPRPTHRRSRRHFFGEGTVGTISADTPCSVLLRDVDGTPHLTVAEPTRAAETVTASVRLPTPVRHLAHR
ncbi:polysaccharide lyase beta-sandwich domain-containing protein [Streptomyces sp. NPDC056663]|uniref:polysaccharide lyase beta-sandwich domain-containing protein n=1 Tax=Streptomyces sp. NPDC056663 TaxID=3345899 RepID=UPI0036748250